MEQRGSLLSWKLSLAETLSFGVTIAALVFFATSNFQSKEDGYKLEKRIDRLEIELSSMRSILGQISSDLAYIRGSIRAKGQIRVTELWIFDQNGTKTVLTLGSKQMETKKLLELLDKHIDQQSLAKDLIVELLIPSIEKFVADTSNPYDDKLVVYLKEYLLKLEV